MRPSRNELGNKTAGGYPPPRDRDAEDPLQSAAGFIFRSTQAMRDRHVGRRELFESEAQSLFAWGQSRGLFLTRAILAIEKYWGPALPSRQQILQIDLACPRPRLNESSGA
jgi:hypothetical protein